MEGVRPETPACRAPAVPSCRKSPEPSRSGQFFAVASSPGPSAWSVQRSRRRQPLPCHSLTRAQRLPLFHSPPHPRVPPASRGDPEDTSIRREPLSFAFTIRPGLGSPCTRHL